MADNPDKALAVEFFIKAVEHPRKSREAGRPIFEDKEYVRIRFPADNKRELVAPADEMHYSDFHKGSLTYAERFDANYNAFKADNDAFMEGTPLAELPFLTESRRKELKGAGVRTAEQLAGMPDSSIKKLGMGYREHVTKAREFIEKAEQFVDTTALQDEIAELKAKLAGMEPKKADDQFAGFEEDDLRNMYQDATGKEADGRWGRSKLIEALAELQEEAAA